MSVDFTRALGLDRGPLGRVLAALNRDGEEARVVGGAVRNTLLHLPAGDIDIATTALPEEVTRRGVAEHFKVVPTGIEHGTVTVIADGMPFEVTTLREDIETDGRHAKVVFGRDWVADARRRDFTINALTVSRDGTLHDDVGGGADIAARRVRFIGDPARRIAEDYLRILRFFRFHASYGHGLPDPAGLHACIVARAGLEALSRERVRLEMMKLLVAAHAVPTLATMTEAGLLVTVLGGVPLLASLSNLAKVEGEMGLAGEPVRRLAALGVSILEDAERLSRRLRLSNAEHDRLRGMADTWRRIPLVSAARDRELLYRLGAEAYVDAMLIAWSRSAAPATDPVWHDRLRLPGRWPVPVFPLRAADFIARGIEKGPGLGAALAAAEQAWIAAGFPAAQDALDEIADAAAGNR